MIELYPKTQTDFSLHGLTLHPTVCTVYHQAGARYDLNMQLPLALSGEYEELDFGKFIKCPVPIQRVPEINLGKISYWQVPQSAASPVPLYKSLGYYQKVSYTAWQGGRSYMQGDKVTYAGQNYRCITGHGGVSSPPPSNPTLWETISNYAYVSGVVAAQLQPGSYIIKTGDFNATYMRAATPGGVAGYVEIAAVEQVGGEEDRILPARVIRDQAFRITQITPNSSAGTVTVHAEHPSYGLNGMLLGECNLISATPQTALDFLQGAMMDSWPGLIVTNINEPDLTVDWSYKMAGAAILNPDSGFLSMTNGKIIRDYWDSIILPNAQEAPVFEIAYGVNMQAIKWDGNVDNLVSRVYPRAKAEDGTALFLPEIYIASARDVPFQRMELLNVDAQVGKTVTATDGTEKTLTLQDVYDQMRQEAQARFDVDLCDVPTIKADVDYVRLGDTSQYARYRDSENISPYDWIRVRHPRLNIDAAIQMIGYEWDAILRRYNRSTFGDVRFTGGRNVTEWQLRSGCITRRALDEDLKNILGV